MTARLLACLALLALPAFAASSVDDEAQAALVRRGLGADALGLIDNVLRHEPTLAPRAVPPLVRRLLAEPLAGADAARIFAQAVPAELAAFTDGGGEAAQPFDRLLDAYVAELAHARALLRSATEGVDDAGLVRALGSQGISDEALLAAERVVKRDLLDQAISRFLVATRRFAAALRAPGVVLPAAQRIDSPIGAVVIGSPGPDRHGPDAALVIDPGGDDVYERAPASGGAISVIVDLGGNDRYTGSDVAVRALSAIVEAGGDDRYEMSGPGLGAAVAGASVIVDYDGNDTYVAGIFGEGAAALGLGAILDAHGNDSYRLQARGQGYGLAGGLGLLWDQTGNDRYTGDGTADFWHREGRVGFTQGVASGYRSSLAGGIGILRDDEGNDIYEAQMFAQGTGYFFGLGLLWDRAGDDVYRAVRYGQGNGVHQAVGVLRDDAGNDRYELTAAFGQGLGHDLGVGILLDSSGDDSYQAPSFAQGTGTGNGFGLLADRAGENVFRLDDQYGWGWGQDLRRLPSVGLLLAGASHARFIANGKELPAAAAKLAIGGPYAVRWSAPAPIPPPPCPAIAPATSAPDTPLAPALMQLAPYLQSGNPPAPAYAAALRAVLDDPRAALEQIRPEDFDVMISFESVLYCAARAANAVEAERLWTLAERTLEGDPASPFALAMAGALRARPPAADRLARVRTALDSHPSCAVRAFATVSWASAAEARRALRSPCWRLRAAALERLVVLGAARAEDRSLLPSFFPR